MSNFTASRLLRALIIASAFTLGAAMDTRAQYLQETLLRHEIAASERASSADLSRRLITLSFSATSERATGWRKAGQIAGGILGASAVGLVAWRLWDDPEGPDRRVKGDEGYTPAANTAYAVGSYIASTISVYAIGRGDGSRGSFLATAIGSGVASIPLFFGRNEPYLPVLGVVLGAPLQAIGGTIGYQQTRRER